MRVPAVQRRKKYHTNSTFSSSLPDGIIFVITHGLDKILQPGSSNFTNIFVADCKLVVVALCIRQDN